MINEQLVVDAAKEVLETSTHVAVEGAKMAGALQPDFTGIAARLSLVGTRSAEVVLLCSQQLAALLASGMLGMPQEEIDEALVSDALGEIVNQLGGTMKRKLAALGSDMTLSVPTVISGKMRLKVLTDSPPVCVDIACEQGPLQVRVWIPGAGIEVS